jgi:hypothetical protein
MEDGYYRQYKVDPTYFRLTKRASFAEKWMSPLSGLRRNYWSLWTESGNLAQYYERYPNGFDTLRRRWAIAFVLRGLAENGWHANELVVALRTTVGVFRASSEFMSKA